MHNKVKGIDKKSMTVYLPAGDRILMRLPHSVQFTVRQRANECDINLGSDNGMEVVEQILKVFATDT